MKDLFDKASAKCSKMITGLYSTSFSIGIHLLDKRFRAPIYGIYGFVRCADEIVDSFHGYDRDKLLQRFRSATYEAIEDGISLNPVLNSFQAAVHQYDIDRDLIDKFLDSMAMDLTEQVYNRYNYDEYILGSAEVVGLMCLKVFTENNVEKYNHLYPFARRLGAAFQKVNFLRDLKSDYEIRGRTYFPNVNVQRFRQEDKHDIESEIEEDFRVAREGIMQLPHGARLGVHVAYAYYLKLFKKITSASASDLMNARLRISNQKKILLMLNSIVLDKLRML
ncbi:MAG: squalene/phytoene synthase family protein [Chitinophagaceae bacterium]|nr:squalene/phytoene synthase family protein [Chitinophagaceae bacterium]